MKIRKIHKVIDGILLLRCIFQNSNLKFKFEKNFFRNESFNNFLLICFLIFKFVRFMKNFFHSIVIFRFFNILY